MPNARQELLPLEMQNLRNTSINATASIYYPYNAYPHLTKNTPRVNSLFFDCALPLH